MRHLVDRLSWSLLDFARLVDRFDQHAVRFYLNLRPSRSFARRRLEIGVSGECHAAPGIPDDAFQDKLLKSTPLGCAPLRPILAGQKAGQANANEAPADQA